MAATPPGSDPCQLGFDIGLVFDDDNGLEARRLAVNVLVLCACLFLQPPTKSDSSKEQPPGNAKPNVSKLLPMLKDLKPEQQAELKKLQDEYAAMIAELEAERDSKLALVLTKEQREKIARLWAEELDRYRVVLKAKFGKPGALFKPMKEILGLDPNEAKARIDRGMENPIAENLTKAKADALVKAFTAAGAKVGLEKQE
jgi:ribosomal protein L7/L12